MHFKGWEKLPSDARAIADLPEPARAYVQTISEMAGVPFCLVSVGPDRSETIRLTDPFAG
jgi:adenylosuccinate synthase